MRKSSPAREDRNARSESRPEIWNSGPVEMSCTEIPAERLVFPSPAARCVSTLRELSTGFPRNAEGKRPVRAGTEVRETSESSSSSLLSSSQSGSLAFSSLPDPAKVAFRVRDDRRVSLELKISVRQAGKSSRARMPARDSPVRSPARSAASLPPKKPAAREALSRSGSQSRRSWTGSTAGVSLDDVP